VSLKNLLFLKCDTTIRQLRQVRKTNEEGEKNRIIYFCPFCQGTNVELEKKASEKLLPPIKNYRGSGMTKNLKFTHQNIEIEINFNQNPPLEAIYK